jgi:hypothetical protein
MSAKQFFLAVVILALVGARAGAALTFDLERVPSNSGAAGPTMVLLVARDYGAILPVKIAGLTGTWSDTTSKNGLKFYIPDPATGDVDASGGVRNVGLGVDADGRSFRLPQIKGTFLSVPFSSVDIVLSTDANGETVESVNDPRYPQGMQSARFISSRTSNTVLSVEALTSREGAILGAAVVGSPWDQVTFTGGTFGVVDADGNALPELWIPDLGFLIPEPGAFGFIGLAALMGIGRRGRRRVRVR